MLKYPKKSYDNGYPCVLFTSYRATYNSDNTSVDLSDKGSIALYMPTNVTIADSMTYQNDQNFLGAIGSLINGTKNLDDISAGDVKALGYQFSDEGAGLVLGGIGAKLGSAIGGILTGGVAMAGVGAYSKESQKKHQVTLNMRDYSVFKGPTLRTFPFEFTFLPESKEESDVVIEIIKEFRRTSYPTTNGVLAYNFPEVYKIDFVNSDDMIKIPEVALQSVTVSYNPNSMSFFKYQGRPVEIAMSLNFQELTLMSAELVDRGY